MMFEDTASLTKDFLTDIGSEIQLPTNSTISEVESIEFKVFIDLF